MREAGDVCFSDVFRDGSGVVEYLRADDVKYAIRKLDDTKFRSHEVRPENDTEARRKNVSPSNLKKYKESTFRSYNQMLENIG